MLPVRSSLIGQDRRFVRQVERAVKLAPSPAPVLVVGESGTGKELLARLLHELGPAPCGPFVAVNCGALSPELAESELFGHERGAFTGADGRHTGWFEEAAGGTLVLDEVGELPMALQPKLLRVLETGRLRRVGGQGERPVDVRIVAVTLRDLRREARRGRFRSDLFHRLSVLGVDLPPLRARPGDIPVLARHFLAELASETGTSRVLTAAALAALARHDWPGNVRELRNVVRRAGILGAGNIDAADLELGSPTRRWPAHASEAGALVAPLPPATRLPPAVAPRPLSATMPPAFLSALPPPVAPLPPAATLLPGGPPPSLAPSSPPARSACGRGDLGGGTLALRGRGFLEMKREIYAYALRACGGSRRRAARRLGISRSTFCDVARRLGL